ncbi:9181_t:CDS:2, partial [Paraglomus occultum]
MVLRYFGSRLVSLRDVEDKRIQALLEYEPRGPSQNPNVRIILCQDTGGKPKLTLYDSANSLASPASESENKPQKTESSWNPFASRSRASEGKSNSSRNGVEMKSNTKPANLKDRSKSLNNNNINSQRK